MNTSRTNSDGKLLKVVIIHLYPYAKKNCTSSAIISHQLVVTYSENNWSSIINICLRKGYPRRHSGFNDTCSLSSAKNVNIYLFRKKARSMSKLVIQSKVNCSTIMWSINTNHIISKSPEEKTHLTCFEV